MRKQAREAAILAVLATTPAGITAKKLAYAIKAPIEGTLTALRSLLLGDRLARTSRAGVDCRWTLAENLEHAMRERKRDGDQKTAATAARYLTRKRELKRARKRASEAAAMGDEADEADEADDDPVIRRVIAAADGEPMMSIAPRSIFDVGRVTAILGGHDDILDRH